MTIIYKSFLLRISSSMVIICQGDRSIRIETPSPREVIKDLGGSINEKCFSRKIRKFYGLK